jgi:outer membrane protein
MRASSKGPAPPSTVVRLGCLTGTCALLVLLASPASSADSAAELALPDIVAVAVRQSPDFERAKYDLDVARANVERAAGLEDVHINVTTSYQYQPDQVLDASDTLALGSASLTISRALPTGGTLAVIGGLQYSDFSAPPSSNLANVTYTSSASLALTQPLLRGAWSKAFEAPIRQAEHARDAARLDREARARVSLVGIVEAYWQVALAWETLEVRKGSLDLANQQLAFTEGAIRSDKLAKSEELAVQEAIAVRQQDVLDAEQQVLDRSLDLRQLVGLEIQPNAVGVKTAPLPQPTPVDLDVATAVAAAYDHSAELAVLAADERGAVAGVDQADGRARSRLDFQAQGGPIGISGGLPVNPNGSGPLTNGTPYRSANILLDHPGYEVFGSLTFDRAVQARTEHGGQEAAHAVLLRARVDTQAARVRIAANATRGVQRAQAALAAIALDEKAIELADANVKAEQRKLELAKSTTFEVLRRQDDLQQVRLRHATSVVNYLNARAELDGLTGAILSQFGIVMQ